MIDRPDGVPRRAEAFDSADYYKGYSAPSVLMPGQTQRRFRLRCPKCSAIQPEAFGTQLCECGLTLHLGCNVLYVWTEKEAADARV